MSIITEYYKTRSDGVVLNRTYSDKGLMIEREGNRYDEAIDPAHLNRVYTETDECIDGNGEATESDYIAALREMGVAVNEEN